MGATSGPMILGSSGRATAGFLGSVQREHKKAYVVYTQNLICLKERCLRLNKKQIYNYTSERCAYPYIGR